MAPTISSRRSGTLEGAMSGDFADEFSVFQITSASKEHPTGIVSNGSHHSLVGFDPMLELSESRDDQGAWDMVTEHHPAPSSPSELVQGDSSDDDIRQRSASDDLRELAAELAKAMPRALTKEEEIEITLGESTKESSSKREKKILQKVAKKSLAPSTPEPAKGKKEGKQSKTVTPSPKDKRKSLRRALSSKMSPRPKQKKSPSSPTKSNSPSTSNETSLSTSPGKSRPTLKKLKTVSKLSAPRRRKNSASSISDLAIPSLAKPIPTSFLKDGSTMALKTSEQDPSSHQVDIPSSHDLSVDSRLCAIMDSYEKLDKNFDLNDFKGVDLQDLHKAVLDESQEIPGMTRVHKVLLQQLLSCADDIQVEGFFTHNEKSRVAIFSMQSSSRFVVAFRGSPEQQLRPVRASNKSMAVNLDSSDNAVPVYAPFRESYFELEPQVYKLLGDLMEQNPFSHVVFVGHSFGGGLATIGAVRFASARPMLRFSCHVFGCPKVGAHEFRTMVNALPNLKIMRVEYGSDPNTGNPTDVGSLKWEHVGHTIAIHGAIGTNTRPPSNPVMAYRFDNKKPPSSLLHVRLNHNGIDHYVGAIEPFAKKQLSWVSSYVGEDGKGVLGKDNEKRLMV